MRTHPIYHWMPRRIKGQFVVYFMAFVLERTLEIQLKRQVFKAFPERIRETINSLELSEVKLDEHVFYLKGKQKPLAGKKFKVLIEKYELPGLLA